MHRHQHAAVALRRPGAGERKAAVACVVLLLAGVGAVQPFAAMPMDGAAPLLPAYGTAYLGKVSPMHLFWGSFDLAVTRFSGCSAPLHPGGIPALPDAVTAEAYSHEVSSAGFWPGGGPVDVPTFYAYAYPTPEGFADASVAPDAAYYDRELGEFLLPYDAVRDASDPDAALMAFLESTYRAAADLGRWPSDTLECAPGEPRRPRPL